MPPKRKAFYGMAGDRVIKKLRIKAKKKDNNTACTTQIGCSSSLTLSPGDMDEITKRVTEKVLIRMEKRMNDLFVMNIPQESTRSSLVLKASGISWPVTKLRQNLVKLDNILYNMFKDDTSKTSMIAGSLGEIFFGLTWKQSDIMFSSDVDLMEINNTFKVHEHIEELEKDKALYPTLKHVLHLPDNTNPGYAILELPDKTTEYIELLSNDTKEQMYQLGREAYPVHDVSIHGPALTTKNLCADIAEHFSAGGTYSMDYKCLKKRKDGIGPLNYKDLDYVSCFRGEKWPAEAAEWAKRHRLSNWPTKQLIQKIINSGYLLAGVASKESKDSPIQWRISFNSAEQLLIESFNETQIHCIWLLKSLKTQLTKDIGKNITSFTMKTVMFWCMEEKSNDYWQSSNLVCCFCFCISKLKCFVEKQFLPNYFIIERNLFVLSEFTSSMQIKTIYYLERLLENPIESIKSFLPKCDINDEIHILERKIKEVFIMEWISATISVTYLFFEHCAFWKLYDRYNIDISFQRCEDASKQLSTLNFTQPLSKALINCMAVLQYAIFKRERETVEQTSDIDNRHKCLQYMKFSLKGNKTNTRLRIATCYLDNGVKAKYQILRIIRKATDTKRVCLLQTHQYFSQRLKNVLAMFEQLPRKLKDKEIEIYNSLFDEDLTNQDPYQIFKQLKLFKKDGHEVGGYKLFKHSLIACWFDVTFMPAEVSILPKPAALELCIDPRTNRVSFNPILYGHLLEFLWHVKNDSNIKERKLVIEKMKNCVHVIPEEQQTKGLNFLTYCCALQQEYFSASRYLIRSFEINPVETNVAYLYIKYIINLLMRTMRGGPC